MITIKEEFLTHPKWLRAVALGGSDAIVMWIALKRYSVVSGTNGFVPDDEVETLPGAPRNARKALKALAECGRMGRDGTRGYGLIEQEQHGWQLHDYLDHSLSAEEEAERKQKARDRKDRWRERNASGTRSETVPEQEPERAPDASGTVPSSLLFSSLHSDNDDDDPRAGISCPPDLSLTDEQRQSLLTSLVPAEIIDRVTVSYRAKYIGGAEKMPLEKWRRGLITAISREANQRSPPQARIAQKQSATDITAARVRAAEARAGQAKS